MRHRTFVVQQGGNGFSVQSYIPKVLKLEPHMTEIIGLLEANILKT